MLSIVQFSSFSVLLSFSSQLNHNTMAVSLCQEFFYKNFIFIFSLFNSLLLTLSFNQAFVKRKRRRRDLNPRAATNDLLPFQGSPFGQLGYFSKVSAI